jgi:hypothetical protein
MGTIKERNNEVIKWLWKLLFKTKRLSFKNGDIFVFTNTEKISCDRANNIHQYMRSLLDKIGCKDSEILILSKGMDIFIIENNNKTKIE